MMHEEIVELEVMIRRSEQQRDNLQRNIDENQRQIAVIEQNPNYQAFQKVTNDFEQAQQVYLDRVKEFQINARLPTVLAGTAGAGMLAIWAPIIVAGAAAAVSGLVVYGGFAAIQEYRKYANTQTEKAAVERTARAYKEYMQHAALLNHANNLNAEILRFRKNLELDQSALKEINDNLTQLRSNLPPRHAPMVAQRPIVDAGVPAGVLQMQAALHRPARLAQQQGARAEQNFALMP